MTGIRTSRDERADALTTGGLVVTGVATLAIAAWMYAMPPSVTSPWGLNPPGLDQFRSLWGLPALDVRPAVFRAGFWLLVAAAWTGYAVLLAGGLRGGGFPRRAWVPAAAVAIAMASACPPLLSRDVYGYVGFGRLAADHHLNPMATPQSRLVALGDPVARFLGGDVPSPYGPLWSGLSVGLVRVASGFGLVGQVLAFKLAMALALLLAARAARRVGEAIASERGPLAFAAVAFNPLLLLEGPGTGHNDLLVLALVLAGLATLADWRPRLAALAVGAGAAIKLVPILLLPWLVVTAGRERRLRDAVVVAGLGLLPVVLALAPFWDGRATLAGVIAWWAEGHHGAAASPWPLALAAASYAAVSWFTLRARRMDAPIRPPCSEDPAHTLRPTLPAQAHSAVPPLARSAADPTQTRRRTAPAEADSADPRPAAGSAQTSRLSTSTMPNVPRRTHRAESPTDRAQASPRRPTPALAALATGWAVASAAAIVFAGGSWFPWYFAWPLGGLLVRWDRRHVAATAFVMALVGLFTGFYAGP